jgi:hypothetical protein
LEANTAVFDIEREINGLSAAMCAWKKSFCPCSAALLAASNQPPPS